MKYALIALIGLLTACKPHAQNQPSWDLTIPGVTSASSPVAADLNQDGVVDIIIGAGDEEWKKTEKGVLAIDGASGQILWQSAAINQMVGTAQFLDITKDGIPDVFIGGRSAELMALNGKNGKKIWEFLEKPDAYSPRDQGWYNFYNGQWVPDQDADGLADLLICNGGDAVLPSFMKDRPPGKIMIISAASGKIVYEAFMPDAQETYFSPVLTDKGDILFGSGGETKPGHLYLCTIDNLKKNELYKSKVIDATTAKGYIAPPVLADFNGDAIKDILVNTAEGQTKLFNGATLKQLWAISCDSCETFSQPAVGNFLNNDLTPDVFVQYAKGKYPNYKKTIQYLIDGKTGQLARSFSDKYFTYCSPLVLSSAGQDVVVLSMIKDSLIGKSQRPFSYLAVFDFKNKTRYPLLTIQAGASFASTPLIEDIDADGHADIIEAISPATTGYFPGSTVFEKPTIELNIRKRPLPSFKTKDIKWGRYMGPLGKSRW